MFLLGEEEREATTGEEVDRFLQEKGQNFDCNTLDWWKKNCKYYPSLAQVARQILCIPATSVPHVFSTAGLTITQQRICKCRYASILK